MKAVGKFMQNKPLNRSMIAAKASKQEEFYPQLSDIEKELRHYTAHFKDKTVLCNCDDPRVSNFFHYFSYNFEKLKLKKLITTSYKNHEPDLFKDRTVLCNCDDPRVSNFFHYFSYNFEKLKLKKLITTSYKNHEPDLF